MACCKTHLRIISCKLACLYLCSQSMNAMASKLMEKLMMKPTSQPASTRTEELRSFAFLAAVMAPVLTGVLIVSYGFLVWIYQMLIGGPPQA